MKNILLLALALPVLLILAGPRGMSLTAARAQSATTAPAAVGTEKSKPVPTGTRQGVMRPASTSPVAIHKPQRLAILIWVVVAGALALLVLVISLSFMRATRRLLLGRDVRHGKTPYVDAWKLAGKRLRPPAPQDGDEDLSDSPDP